MLGTWHAKQLSALRLKNNTSWLHIYHCPKVNKNSYIRGASNLQSFCSLTFSRNHYSNLFLNLNNHIWFTFHLLSSQYRKPLSMKETYSYWFSVQTCLENVMFLCNHLLRFNTDFNFCQDMVYLVTVLTGITSF